MSLIRCPFFDIIGRFFLNQSKLAWIKLCCYYHCLFHELQLSFSVLLRDVTPDVLYQLVEKKKKNNLKSRERVVNMFYFYCLREFAIRYARLSFGMEQMCHSH